MGKSLYKVELLIDNTWTHLHWFANIENAEANAQVHAQSKKTMSQIIFEGKKVGEYDYSKGGEIDIG